MRTAKTISITLPPDLLVKALDLAHREHRTISELFREALRRYMASDPEWEARLRRTRAAGKALRVTTEADVERLSENSAGEGALSRAMTRVVADTNIYISALMFGGLAGVFLELALDHAFQLI